MKAQFTPGPWIKLPGVMGGMFCIWNYHELQLPIAKDVNEADANLIAAAPEMLEALESLVARCEHLKNLNGVKDIIAKQLDDAKQAIAKARGE